MAQYVWHFGFDCNAAPIAGNEGFPYLQNGLVKVENPDQVLGNAQTFTVGDTVSFEVFDLTAAADQTSSVYSIVGGSISFVSAKKKQLDSSPFGQSTLPFNIPGRSTQGQSRYFVNQSQYPYWWLLPAQKVVNKGNFLFIANLIVRGTGGDDDTITFRVDPEMIVGGAT